MPSLGKELQLSDLVILVRIKAFLSEVKRGGGVPIGYVWFT